MPSNKEDNILYNRDTIPNDNIDASKVEGKTCFTLVSYNILAPCHMRTVSDDASEELRLANTLDDRHTRLMEELRYLDADIVCLQEVGPKYFSDRMLLDMESLGYGGAYRKRVGDTPLHEEGGATFIRKERFDWLKSDSVCLRESADLKAIATSTHDDDTKAAIREYIYKPDVVLIEHIKCRQSGQKLVIGNIHVTWSELKYPDIQALQISCAFDELITRSDEGNTPHILCGDFNSPYTFPGYQLATQGCIDNDHMAALLSYKWVPLNDKQEALVSLLPDNFQHSSKFMKSAYKQVQGEEPKYTGTEKLDCLDYIFYDSWTLQPMNVLHLPNLDDIDAVPYNTATPQFHSDHLSLKSTFTFV